MRSRFVPVAEEEDAIVIDKLFLELPASSIFLEWCPERVEKFISECFILVYCIVIDQPRDWPDQRFGSRVIWVNPNQLEKIIFFWSFNIIYIKIKKQSCEYKLYVL